MAWLRRPRWAIVISARDKVEHLVKKIVERDAEDSIAGTSKSVKRSEHTRLKNEYFRVFHPDRSD